MSEELLYGVSLVPAVVLAGWLSPKLRRAMLAGRKSHDDPLLILAFLCWASTFAAILSRVFDGPLDGWYHGLVLWLIAAGVFVYNMAWQEGREEGRRE